MIKDAAAISKYFVMYVGMVVVTSQIDKDKLMNQIAFRSQIYIYVMALYAIVNFIIDIDMHVGVRNGFRSFTFLFPHPTYLVAAVVMLITVLVAVKKVKPLDVGCALGVILLTFRSKGYLFIFGYIVVMLAFRYAHILKGRFNKAYIFALLACIPLGGALVYDKAMSIFAYGYTAARPALYLVGLELANKYFPIGSGLGTFASSLSGEYYSPIYEEFKLTTVYGLTPEKYNYMADTFWPYIYGQFGYLGLIMFVITLCFIAWSLIGRYFKEEQYKAVVLIIMYILIASTAEAVFTDSTGAFMFIILAAYLGNDRFFKRNRINY